MNDSLDVAMCEGDLLFLNIVQAFFSSDAVLRDLWDVQDGGKLVVIGYGRCLGGPSSPGSRTDIGWKGSVDRP
jgi:hypothetical protein